MTYARNPRGIEFPDYCSGEAAAHLAKKLEDYWRRRGFAVNTQLVPVTCISKDHGGQVFELRSDMVGGFPIKKIEG